MRDTHKFESRYPEPLIGEYPEEQEEYQKRSPIHSVEQMKVALCLFQGANDKVRLVTQLISETDTYILSTECEVRAGKVSPLSSLIG